MQALKLARNFHVSGIVQGVGFRPFVYREANERGLTGWVLNAGDGVEIRVEGDAAALDGFATALRRDAPAAARIDDIESSPAAVEAFPSFEIRPSRRASAPVARVCADLPVCEDCLRELFDPHDARYRYPYINCTNCGPRYSIIQGLPYDRERTTMRAWRMCDRCRSEYDDPLNRRFHAQPVACPACGPNYALEERSGVTRGYDAIVRTAELLRAGAVVGIKGIGGFHLACDARNPVAVHALRERKYRKERPFALMTRTAVEAQKLAEFDEAALAALTSSARPIVLAPARESLANVAPENDALGVMLAYTPLHHLLFNAGSPDVLVMTSANRSSEPIAYQDPEARSSLRGIAEALLIGERQIARRIDDSVVAGMHRTSVIRHARGYAPQAVATLPSTRPILALGADLKNAVALVVGGQAFMSQHIGDLEHLGAFEAFKQTISDLEALYEVPPQELRVVHDAHPQYASSAYACELPGEKLAVQHHRAHIASVLAEREAFDEHVLGFAFDGTGYGEDGSIWGGEVFCGSLSSGFERVAHLRQARLPGGDAAALFPAQAAAGFLAEIETPDLLKAPFDFPQRYRQAEELLRANVRVFPASSMGRLFDTAAALCGFTRAITFEAQAAMWLESLARGSPPVSPYPFPFAGGVLDYRPLLAEIVSDRTRGRDVREIARAFHAGVASAILSVVAAHSLERVVISGGVFQNQLLLGELAAALGERLWTNRIAPANDGGICLGQAALACFC